MHKLLITQIKHHLGGIEETPPEWKGFLEAVNSAYKDADEDNELMDRAMAISSKELIEKNTILMDEIIKRKHAENKLLKINSELELRVESRTKELVSAKEEAERASKAKSEFLSSMSHELRTPMNAILGFSQLLMTDTREPLSASQEFQANEILKAGNHLLELISEILDLSGIESGEIHMSIENVDLAKLVEETLLLIAPLAEKKAIQISNQIEEQFDVWVLADRTRLKQVLLNLLSNSIKYTPCQGAVTISLSESENRVSISVTDSGVGISKEKMGLLFEPFNRLGAEHTETEGTGIGLSISKRLVNMMNGTIDVESTLGKGSSFTIQIPVGENQEKAYSKNVSAIQSKVVDSNTETIHKLLYVEDNPANLKLVEKIFATRNTIELMSAPEPKLGIELACHHRPNLILLDINLPGMNGFTVLKYLKANKATRDIPIIAVSANASQFDIDKALEAGFESYITKPLNVVSFLETVDKILSQSVQSTGQ